MCLSFTLYFVQKDDDDDVLMVEDDRGVSDKELCGKLLNILNGALHMHCIVHRSKSAFLCVHVVHYCDAVYSRYIYNCNASIMSCI